LGSRALFEVTWHIAFKQLISDSFVTLREIDNATT
jgi:hypothetical protein